MKTDKLNNVNRLQKKIIAYQKKTDELTIKLKLLENEQISKENESLKIEIHKTKKNLLYLKKYVKKIEISKYFRFLRTFNRGKSKIKQVFNKKYLPLWIVLAIFSTLSLSALFQNNDYFNLLASFHIDTGSILGSIFTIMNKENFYNQNLGYHTSYYGFPYNSIIFILFTITRKLFDLNVVDNFPVFAVVARAFTFFTSFVTLCLIYFFAQKILKNILISTITALSLAFFPGFFFYSYLIKPDILALLFLLLSFLSIYKYLNEGKKSQYIIGVTFAALSVFTKQPYIFVGAPLVMAYFLRNNFNLKNVTQLVLYFLESSLLVIPLFFIIHPYAFINFKYFISRQRELTGMTSSPMSENITTWIRMYSSYPIIFVGYLSSLIVVATYFFNRNIKTSDKIIFLISLFSLIYTTWLTLSVGPIRVIAYLIPVFGLFSIVIARVYNQIGTINLKNIEIEKLTLSKNILKGIILIIAIYTIVVTIRNSTQSLAQAHDYKNSVQVRVSNELLQIFPSSSYIKSRILFTASMPVQQYKFKEARYIWQYITSDTLPTEIINAYNPDIIVVDTSQYYEHSYAWWKDVLKDTGLKNERIYPASKKNKDKMVVIFYK
jgi:hypothetical protein